MVEIYNFANEDSNNVFKYKDSMKSTIGIFIKIFIKIYLVEFIGSLPDKSGTSCYHLVTRLMMATGLLRGVPTSYKPIIYTGCS